MSRGGEEKGVCLNVVTKLVAAAVSNRANPFLQLLSPLLVVVADQDCQVSRAPR